MAQQKTAPQFNFISSYRGMCDYGIQAPGDPLDGHRIEIQTFADPLYGRDGKRQFNYTPEEYDRWVIAALGYMHRLDGSVNEPLSLDYARAFNAQALAEYQAGLERWRDKYPNDVDIYLEHEPFQIKGTCWLVHVGPGEWDLAWAFADL